jgi:hypothetical protein
MRWSKTDQLRIPGHSGAIRTPIPFDSGHSFLSIPNTLCQGRGQAATLNKGVNDTEGLRVSRPLRIEYPGAFYHVTSRSAGGVVHNYHNF